MIFGINWLMVVMLNDDRLRKRFELFEELNDLERRIFELGFEVAKLKYEFYVWDKDDKF